MWVIFAAPLLWLAIGVFDFCKWWKKRPIRKKWKRLYNMEHKTERGYLTVGDITYRVETFHSYSVDSEGKSYTHIGGGGSISIPEICNLQFFPGAEERRSSNYPPIILYCQPGKVKALESMPGCGIVEYVMDSDGKSYFIRWRTVPNQTTRNLH